VRVRELLLERVNDGQVEQPRVLLAQTGIRRYCCED
jgi:DNA-directed RNA polymerase subunit N (RpoN/RPB10)